MSSRSTGGLSWWLAGTLCVSCAHRAPNAERFFVAGTAYLCSPQFTRGKFAVGKTVRLMTGAQVLAQDVVGPDGSFVLHPRQDEPVSGPVVIEADGKRLSLTNDYASWLQSHLHYRAEVQFGCVAQPAASTGAGTSEPIAEPPAAAPPPARLIPRQPL